MSHSRDSDNLIPFLLGRNAINYLIESLSIKAIALPSFICPMVIDIFKHHQVEIFFYEGLTKKLQVPINDILTTLESIQSKDQLFFLWHDYLNIIGDIPTKLYNYLEKNKIESLIDATHSLPTKEYLSPTVVFGFRKLLNEPFGSLVKLNDSETFNVKTSPPVLKIWLIFLTYRLKSSLLFIFKFFNSIAINKFLIILSNIDRPFNFDSNALFLYENFKSKSIIDKHRVLDYQKICQNRQRNFLRYVEKLPVFFNLEDFDISCPFGFPLLINDNVLIRKKLWEQGIHSFILWNPLHDDLKLKDAEISKYLSDLIIILPVNHDLNIEDIDRIVEVINE
jgi:hypothetical protein